MVGQTAEAIACVAVDEVEPGKRAAEPALAIILQSANHGNEVNALDSLREPRYPHVMSIAQIGRYMPATTLSIVAPARSPSLATTELPQSRRFRRPGFWLRTVRDSYACKVGCPSSRLSSS